MNCRGMGAAAGKGGKVKRKFNGKDAATTAGMQARQNLKLQAAELAQKYGKKTPSVAPAAGGRTPPQPATPLQFMGSSPALRPMGRPTVRPGMKKGKVVKKKGKKY